MHMLVFIRLFTLYFDLKVFVIIDQTIFYISAVFSGVFWQITDIHYDANYSTYPPDTGYVCHLGSKYRNLSGRAGNGTYGDFNCDSPWSLVTSAFHAMKTLYTSQEPDFIIWTGYAFYKTVFQIN